MKRPSRTSVGAAGQTVTSHSGAGEAGARWSIRRVMAVLEAGAHADAAVAEGVALAAAHRAELVVLHWAPELEGVVVDAVPDPSGFAPMPDEHELQVARERAGRRVSAALAAAAREGVEVRVLVAVASDGAKGIARAAQEQACDVVVIASEGGNAVTRLVTGSLVPGVITESPVPVLICPGDPEAAQRLRNRRRRLRHRRAQAAAGRKDGARSTPSPVGERTP